MKLCDVVAGVPGVRITGDQHLDITNIEYDSRLVQPGSLFVALRGGYVDGHAFTQAARERGAIAAVVESGMPPAVTDEYRAVVEVEDTRAALALLATNFYDRPSSAMTIVGVTGTDGKTTTSHFIDAMSRFAGMRTGLIGTVTVRIGDEEDLHESRQTTPESLLIQRYLATMRDRGVDLAVIEATSHGLELHRLDGCDFDIGVVTNVTHEHLDFHGTVENYRAAKGGLFRRVAGARARGKRGIAALNIDDVGARSLEPYTEGSRIVRYSPSGDQSADLTARDVELSADSSSFLLVIGDQFARVTIHLPGRYNIANALAAAATGIGLGLDITTIAGGLESLRSVPGRMETVDQGQPFTVIVDYAHTPEAIRSVLREVRRLTRGQLMVLFGSAGERDVEKRPIQGAVAVTDADYAVFTSEDPRFEDPERIVEDIAAGAVNAGGRRGVDFDCIEDRRQAIAEVFHRARTGDVVVLAGKGHEKSMIYGAEKRPWDEAAIAREILREMGYHQSNDGSAAR